MPDPARESSRYATSLAAPWYVNDVAQVDDDTDRANTFSKRLASSLLSDTAEATQTGAKTPMFGGSTDWYVPANAGGYVAT